MHVHRNATVLTCAICERTLLLGERAAGYRAHGTSQTVCELCVDVADRRGWLRAGAPDPPPVQPSGGRGPGLFGRVAAAVRSGRPAAEAPPLEDLPPDPAL